MTDLVMGDDGSRIGDSDNDHDDDAARSRAVAVGVAPGYFEHSNNCSIPSVSALLSPDVEHVSNG